MALENIREMEGNLRERDLIISSLNERLKNKVKCSKEMSYKLVMQHSF